MPSCNTSLTHLWFWRGFVLHMGAYVRPLMWVCWLFCTTAPTSFFNYTRAIMVSNTHTNTNWGNCGTINQSIMNSEIWQTWTYAVVIKPINRPNKAHCRKMQCEYCECLKCLKIFEIFKAELAEWPSVIKISASLTVKSRVSKMENVLNKTKKHINWELTKDHQNEEVLKQMLYKREKQIQCEFICSLWLTGTQWKVIILFGLSNWLMELLLVSPLIVTVYWIAVYDRKQSHVW